MQTFEMTEADRAWMDAEQENVLAAMKAEDERQQGVLDQIKGKVSAEVFADIKACMEDSGSVSGFNLAVKPLGQEQDDGYSFGPYFVNQTCNGGYTGDEFAGSISIRIGVEDFFEFNYLM